MRRWLVRCSGPLRSTDYHGLLREQMRLRKQLRTPHVHFQKQTRMLKSRIRKQSCIPKTRLSGPPHITKTHSTHRNTKSAAPPNWANAFGTRTSLRLRIRFPTAFERRWRLRERLLSSARRRRKKALGCGEKSRCSSRSTGASASFACWPQAAPRKAFRPF